MLKIIMNNELNISKKELNDLIVQKKSCKIAKNAYRLNVIILLAKGYTYLQIEDALLIDERTARRYKNIYLEQGIDGLFSYHYKGSESNLTKEQFEELTKHIEENIYMTAKEICIYVFKKYKVKYKPESMVKILNKLGFVYKKTKLIPGKADPIEQKKFVRKYKKKRKNLKKNETILFIDAVHPTHNTMASYAWIKKGEEKTIQSNTGRMRININGAYNPITHDIITVDDKTINAQSTIKLFEMIEKKYPEMKRIIVYGDKARYYTSKIVKEYLKTSRIVFEHLPTYSPNLNLIERLWKFFKKQILYNKYYESYNDFRNAALSFFKCCSRKHKKELETLMVENFHIFAL